MKHWTINYSIRYIDGTVEEVTEVLEARNLGQAFAKIRDTNLARPEVSQVVILSICIIEDEVFDGSEDTADV